MKEAYYFPHYSNARNDRKIKRIRKVHGPIGYAAYFMILEILRDQTDYKYPIQDIDLLSDDFGVSEGVLSDIINNYELFVADKGFFWSENLVKFLDPFFKMKEQRRKAGIASGISRQRKSLEDNHLTNGVEHITNDRSTTAQRMSNENEQSKVKESKVKKIPPYNPPKNPDAQTSHPLGDWEVVKDEERVKRKPAAKGDPDFEKAWVDIKGRGVKAKALVEWKKLSEDERLDAIAYLPTYVASVRDPAYIVHFERYLRNRYWDGKSVALPTKFPWPAHIPIHDAFDVAFQGIKRVDCDFPHEAAKAWFWANQDWERRFGGAK